MQPEDLIATVKATGYTAALPVPSVTAEYGERKTEQDAKDRDAAGWWQRLVISGPLTVPVLLMSMVPALQFDRWH